MGPMGTVFHATGPALPMAHSRAVAVLGLGVVVFAAICYLWYRDYRRLQRGDTG